MFLNCHTYYSNNCGVISPEKLVEEALGRGIKRLALTDINCTSGIFDFVLACRKAHIEAVAGIEFRNEFSLCYVGMAKTLNGFANLNRFLSTHNFNKTTFQPEAPALEDVFWIYPENNLPARQPFAWEWLACPPYAGGWKLPSLKRHDFFSEWVAKGVAFQPVVFLDRQSFDLHRLLRCIDQNVLLSKLQKGTIFGPDATFPTCAQMLDWYKEAPELIFRTEALLEQCSFPFDFEGSKNKKTFSPDKTDDMLLLRKRTEDGLLYRYGKSNKVARQRIASELKIIEQLDFASYFLITLDIIDYARNRGYYHIGRGSGANSIVAYCLGITDVDPIELDLYFERFINPKRTSPPDFDIDFSWDERREIQDYIFKRYGRDHVAMIGTYVTYHHDSTVRELCKVFGVPPREIDGMVSQPSLYQDTKIMKWINRYGSLMKDMPNAMSVHAGGILISEDSIYNYTALNLPPVGFPATQFDMYVAEDIGFAKFDILSQRGLGHIKEAVDIIYENCGVHVDVHAVQRFKNDPKIKEQIESSETIGCFYIESPAMRQLMSKLRCNNYLTLVAASSIIRPGVSSSGMMKAYIERFHNPDSFTYIHPVMKTLLAETYGVMIYQEDVIKVAHHFAGLDLADADVLRRAMSGKYRARSEFDRIKAKFFSNCQERHYPDDIAAEVWRQIESFSGYSFSKAHSASYAVESYQSLFLKTYYPKEFMVAVINNSGGFYRREIYVHEAKRSGATVEAPCVNNSKTLACIKKDVIYLGLGHIRGLREDNITAILEEREAGGKFRSLAQFLKRVPVGLEQLVILVEVGAFRFMGLPKAELIWEAHILCQGKPQRNDTMPLFADDGLEEVFALPQMSPNHPVVDAYDELALLDFTLCSPFALTDWREELQYLPTLKSRKSLLPVEMVTLGLWHTDRKSVLCAKDHGKHTDHGKEQMPRVFNVAQQSIELMPQVEEDALGNAVLSACPSVSDLKKHYGKFVMLYAYLITTKHIRTKRGDTMNFGCFIDHKGHFLDTVHFPQTLQQWPFRGNGVYRLEGKVVQDFGFFSLEVNKMVKLGRKGDPRAG